MQARDQSPGDSGALNGSAAGIRIQQLEQALEALLALLESRSAQGSLTLHDPVLALAREHVDQAVAAGAGAQHRIRLEALLGKIAQTKSAFAPPIDSKTPHLNGVVLPTVPVILKTSNPYAGKTSKELRDAARSGDLAARNRNDRRSGLEQRRFKRYSAPTLAVRVEDIMCRTVDWSIGGLALIGCHTELPRGYEVRLAIAAIVPTIEPASFPDRAIVTRCDPETSRLYLRFRSTASATLKILEYLSRQRVEPIEAATAG